MDYGVEIIN